jgi:hypothetical protein
MDSTDHYSVKLIFQAHLCMYPLTYTDSFVQPIADTNRQSCTTGQAALYQGICNVSETLLSQPLLPWHAKALVALATE